MWQDVVVPAAAVSATFTFDLDIQTWDGSPSAVLTAGVCKSTTATRSICGDGWLGKQLYTNVSTAYSHITFADLSSGAAAMGPGNMAYRHSIPVTVDLSFCAKLSPGQCLLTVAFHTRQPLNDTATKFNIAKPSLIFGYPVPKI